jgi:hypothetical protein
MQLPITSTKLAKLSGTVQTRRLLLRNTGSSTAYFGFEDTVTASAGATQGVPLKADEILAIDQDGKGFGDSLYFICASGQTTTINYTRREY